MADTPRLIPPAWGATPAPPGAEFPATSGWDPDNDALDVYVFLPGGDYGRLRADLLRLTGPTELPPLYLFGNFHSRYHPYSDLAELYEDDGQSNGYRQGACRRTPLEVRMDGQGVTVSLGPAAGSYPGALEARAWVLRLHWPPGLAPVREVRVDGAVASAWRLLPQGPAATPFQLEGPALDGQVLELRLAPEPVARSRRVELN